MAILDHQSFMFMPLVQVVAAIICVLFVYRLLFKKKTLPTNWPLVGMLPTFLGNYHQLYDKIVSILALNEGTFILKTAWFAGADILITSDPENVQHIMSKSFSNYPKGAESKRIFDVFGDMLFNADLDEWRGHRKMIHAFFNDQRFNQQITPKVRLDVIEKGLIPMFDHLSKTGMQVNLQDLFQRLMFDATCMMLTGFNPRSTSVEFPEMSFAKAMDEASEVILYRHLLPEKLWKFQGWLGLGEEKKMNRAKKALEDFAFECIQRRKQDLILSGESYDAIKLFLTKDEVIGSIEHPYSALRDTLIGLMFAGRDTTSVALTWFFWLLSDHPEVEKKIVGEMEENGWNKEAQKHQLIPTDDVVNKLAYLHGALSEALRLFPPAPFQCRTPLEPDVLPSGHRVKPSMKVVLSAYAMGRMKSIWGEDCMEFKPERWITGRGGKKVEPSKKFTAFSSGPRICPGKEFAFVLMRAVAAAIIPRYSVEVVKSQTVTAAVSIILHMEHGVKVRVTKKD